MDQSCKPAAVQRVVDQTPRCYRFLMVRFLLLHGFTREPRSAVWTRVKDAIQFSGGFVLQATAFSNKSLAVSFELPAARIPDLGQRLSDASIVFYEDSAAALAQVPEDAADDCSDLTAMLNVAFLHDEPDEKTEVPSVPG